METMRFVAMPCGEKCSRLALRLLSQKHGKRFYYQLYLSGLDEDGCDEGGEETELPSLTDYATVDWLTG